MPLQDNEQAERGSVVDQERFSLSLLLSILAFLVVSAVLEKYRVGEFLAMAMMYVTVVTASLELSQRKKLRLPAILIAGGSLIAVVLGYFYGGFWLPLLEWSFLAIFFGFTGFNLFRYLGLPGPVTSGRLYASVSLYFILGIFWLALYRVVETVYPGSFALTGASVNPLKAHLMLLYFSLETLTTLGYGDVLPLSPLARILATLEAAAGVLYIAITVARLVGAYQRSDRGA